LIYWLRGAAMYVTAETDCRITEKKIMKELQQVLAQILEDCRATKTNVNK
jgi:hypothetical protein